MRYELISMVRDLVFQFGGLLIWPVARIVDREMRRRNEVLRGIFTMHIVAGCLVLAATILCTILEVEYYVPTFLYLGRIGMLSVAASVITIAATKKRDPDDY